jgi:hypothetical protein
MKRLAAGFNPTRLTGCDWPNEVNQERPFHRTMRLPPTAQALRPLEASAPCKPLPGIGLGLAPGSVIDVSAVADRPGVPGRYRCHAAQIAGPAYVTANLTPPVAVPVQDERLGKAQGGDNPHGPRVGCRDGANSVQATTRRGLGTRKTFPGVPFQCRINGSMPQLAEKFPTAQALLGEVAATAWRYQPDSSNVGSVHDPVLPERPIPQHAGPVPTGRHYPACACGHLGCRTSADATGVSGSHPSQPAPPDVKIIGPAPAPADRSVAAPKRPVSAGNNRDDNEPDQPVTGPVTAGQRAFQPVAAEAGLGLAPAEPTVRPTAPFGHAHNAVTWGFTGGRCWVRTNVGLSRRFYRPAPAEP